MNRQYRAIAVGVALGIVAVLIYMPVFNSCLLNFDRGAMPVQLADSHESPFGMVACDSFRSPVLHWLTLLALPLLLCAVGVVSSREATKRTLVGGAAAGVTMLVSFFIGKLIYPWLEVYWLSDPGLLLAVPMATIFGAIGGWFGGRMPNNVFKGRCAKRARP